ncbi:MAG: TonB-dependent receptor [Acidobacteria bacterium]|nr:TonB-dependent receptor [Acidobacteriota bacterium]
MRRLTSMAFAVLLVAAFCVTAFAQGTSTLTGTVTDPNGAVVSGATVTATNVATNVSTSTQTTDAGVYRFPTLPVGDYNVKVEGAGFSTAQIERVVLTVAQVVTQDVKLAVGAATETVTVVAGGEQLAQPSESSVSQLLNRNVWETYPLENRDTNEFINLLPGAVPDEFAGSTRGAAVNGVRGGTGNFLVDGFDNNDQGQGGRGALVSGGITSISPEAIQEYRVITNNYAAQYGKGGGFVTDTVLRGGTNDVHGSLFEYNRIQKLAANDFFSNSAGVHDSLVRNQFGGSFGGPIVKDKTFAFGTAEFQRLRQAAPLTTVGTTQQFINFVSSGAFATFMESNPNGLCVVANGAPCPGAFTRSRTLGANYRALTAAQAFPLATRNLTNEAGGLFTAGILDSPIIYPVPVYGDVTVVNPSFLNLARFSVKVDHTFNSNSNLTATFLSEDSDNGDAFGGGDGGIGAPFLSPGRSILTGLTFNHTWTPTITSESKASYLRHRRDFPECPGTEGMPSVVTGFDPLGVSLGCSASFPQFFTDNQFQLQQHFSMLMGAHSFRTGVEYRRIRNGSVFATTKNGLILPNGVEELLTDGFFGDEADLALFGAPTLGAFLQAQVTIDPRNGNQPEYYRGFRANEWAAYFQDDWKVRRNLTFNLGLRWEYFGPPHNFRPGLDSNFYFGSASTPVASASTNPFFPRNNPLTAEVANGGFQQRDSNIWQKDWNNFAPRAGFAWDVFNDQKLVVRGGAGIFYDRIWNNLFENIRFNPPTFSFNTINSPAIGGSTPIGPLASPGLYTVPFAESSRRLFNNAAFAGLPAPRHMDENLVTPYVQQFFLGVQHEFLKDFLVEANYITTAGKKLTGVIDINTYPGRTRGGSSLRPNTHIAGDNFRTNAFSSIYHGAQFSLRNRGWHGLQFQSNYTFAKAIDQLSDAFNADARHGNFRPQNPFNIRLDRGRADFDVRHRFVTGFSYDAPFLKENRWLGGWTATGIVTIQSGVPFTVYNSGQDPNADGYLSDRVVFLGTNAGSIYTNKSPADGYFDTTQFVGMNTRVSQFLAAAGTDPTARANAVRAACGPNNGVVVSATQWWCDGTLGRNTFTGPGFWNVDFGLHKKFKVTENSALQLQANAFNIFNHTNFGIPVGNMNSSNFGRSIFTVGTPRVMQLAIRYDF